MMKMKHIWGAAVLTLLAAMPAGAQVSGAVDSYQVRYYAPGAQAPLQVGDAFPFSAVVCNQVPPPNTVTINPTRLVWDDPLVSGHVCIYTVSQGGSLFSLPVGNYEATLAAINAAGSSGESNRATFSRVATLAAPSGFKVIR